MFRLFSHLISALVACLCLVNAPRMVQGQDDAVPSPNAATAFQNAQKKWSDLETAVKATQFRTASPAEQAKLKAEYDKLYTQAEPLLKELRTTAEAAFNAAPNTNPEVVSTLVRMLADDIRRDDYEPALQLAQQMIAKECPDGSLYNFAGIAAYSSDDFANAQKWLKIAESKQRLDDAGANCLSDAAPAEARFAKEVELRKKEAAANDLPRVRMETNRGVIVLELFENEAPEAVANFISLVEAKYYDGLTFHRVLENFMAQGGCPDGTGAGGPGYKIYCECAKGEHRKHFRGTLSMAHAGKDTGGSQFFLTFRPTPFLDGRHTAFGRVIEGWDILTKIQRRDPNNPTTAPDKMVRVTIERKRDHAYVPNKVK
jgi:cyclophilin family peptidyl-prolyl cis-trans isomerase